MQPWHGAGACPCSVLVRRTWGCCPLWPLPSMCSASGTQPGRCRGLAPDLAGVTGASVTVFAVSRRVAHGLRAVHLSSQFRCPTGANLMWMQENVDEFGFDQEYLYQSHLYGLEGRPPGVAAADHAGQQGGAHQQQKHYGPQWALLEFTQPVTAPKVAALSCAQGHMSRSASTCTITHPPFALWRPLWRQVSASAELTRMVWMRLWPWINTQCFAHGHQHVVC